jgi:hypothetical protein
MAVNRSEEFVEYLCRRSFLTLWSHPNPLGRNDKELCDTLIVCDPDVIIISVKDVSVSLGPSLAMIWRRWRRRSISASVKQIYGAERWLASVDEVKTGNGETVPLPAKRSRRYYRIAVALGGKGAIPVTSGDFGKGFVHVFDEVSATLILRELDTISDFVSYLCAKERLTEDTKVVLNGGEEDLLAVYLHRGRKFPSESDVLVIEPDTWNELTSKPEYLRRLEADKKSRMWDSLIESVTRDYETLGLEFGGLKELESVARVMAREDRFARRVLSESLDEFLTLAAARKVRSRIVPSLSGTHYVFLASDRTASRDHRVVELQLRCFVARGLAEEYVKVVGIATEQPEEGGGSSLDFILLDIPEWSEEHEEKKRGIQHDLGYFADAKATELSIDEYPTE